MHLASKNMINLLFALTAAACSQNPKVADVAPANPKPSAAAPSVTQPAPPPPTVAIVPTPPQAKPTAPVPNPEYQAFFDESVQRINQYRASKQLPALTRDPRLDTLAANHSQYMATKDDLNHDGFNSRFDQAKMQSCAENVAWNQVTAAELVSDWIASPIHDKNLLKASATLVGMGRAKGYTTYFVCQP
jgi:uncharacterized protein YkwD